MDDPAVNPPLQPLKVGILDTGINYKHSAFRGEILMDLDEETVEK